MPKSGAKPKKSKPRLRRKAPTELGRLEEQNGFARTRKDHSLERAEDYVELIAALIAEKGEARAVDMARCLGVSHVTVTRTLGRLQKAGWIHTEPYRSVFLTPEGRNLASAAKVRHQIVLEFLIEAGVPGPSAAIDAEGIEHHVSPETLSVMKRLTAQFKKGKKSRTPSSES